MFQIFNFEIVTLFCPQKLNVWEFMAQHVMSSGGKVTFQVIGQINRQQ